VPGHVEQHTARHDRLDRLDAELGESDVGLHARIDLDAAEHLHVLGLVTERVDVGARVLGHDHERRCSRARLAGARLVAAMEREVEPRLVGREDRRAITGRPERLNLRVLVVLCEILNCVQAI